MADALFDRALELVMDAGQTLLENGGEVFRAQQTMEIMAASLGVRDILNGDYLSGSIRLLDALLIAGSIAGGVVLGWIMARGLGVA